MCKVDKQKKSLQGLALSSMQSLKTSHKSTKYYLDH